MYLEVPWQQSCTPAPAARPSPAPQDILAFVHQLGFHPDPVQAQILQTASQRVLVNCSRQWGKSTVVALRAAWQALAQPGSLILVVSRGEKQSGEFVAKAARFLRAAGHRLKHDRGNRISLVLPNGSRILGLASVEQTIRSFSVSMLVLDEAAQIPDAVYDAVLPMLASTGGSLWLLSTPYGCRGFFWQEWMRGEEWHRFRVPATECPRIHPDFLAEMRRKRGDDHIRQEYLCEFVSADDRLFDHDQLASIVAADIPPERDFSGSGREFFFGVDLGKLTDYSAIAIVEQFVVRDGFDPYLRSEVWKIRNVVRHLERVRLGTSYPRVVERVAGLVEKASAAGRCSVVVDATGVGEPVVDALRAERMGVELIPVTLTGGAHSVRAAGGSWHVPKKEILVGLQGMVARREIEVSSALALRDDFFEEMAAIGRGLRAEGKAHDDMVMAVGLACWKIRGRKRWPKYPAA